MIISVLLTSNGVWVSVVQFERHAFDEMGQIIGTSDDIRVWVGGCATYCDRPFVGVARGSCPLLIEETGRVPEDNRTVYAQTLFENTYDVQRCERNRKVGMGLDVTRTLTRTRSAAIVVVFKTGYLPVIGKARIPLFFLNPSPTPSTSTFDSQWSSPLSLTVRTENLHRPAEYLLVISWRRAQQSP